MGCGPSREPTSPQMASPQRYDANKVERDAAGNRMEKTDQMPGAMLSHKKYISLETLAIDVGCDQLMAAESVAEVLSMGYLELQKKYGITGNQYARIKEYKENR